MLGFQQGSMSSETLQRALQEQPNALLGKTARDGSIDLAVDRQPSQSGKKKRSLPGTPDPDAEVIALSPRTLMATNRFTCEICSKGFQREQNLQLHRRGHNLPWKLRRRSAAEVRAKRVYVCPEASCVHHDPARALGDLTGVKKHYCRKHGEKRWKCERCCKRYAVQSDWKAHMKICGTKEYRCDCGSIFSRRDSFVTHRAFCDALAKECNKLTTTALISPPPSYQHDLTSIPFNNPYPSTLPSHPTPALHCLQLGESSTEASAYTSATELLQKAAQMGATTTFAMGRPLEEPQQLMYGQPPNLTTTMDFMGLGGENERQRLMRQSLMALHHHPYQ